MEGSLAAARCLAQELSYPGRVRHLESIAMRWCRRILGVVLGLGLIACGPRGAKEYNEGVRLLNEGQYKAAIVEFEAAFEKNPDFAEALLSAGLGHFKLKQLDKSRELTTRGIKLLEQGRHVKTADGMSPEQKLGLGHWHLGLVEEERYMAAVVKDDKTALKHLQEARARFEEARKLDSGQPRYAERIEYIDQILKKLDG